ncbi:MAG: cysteine--tRNA ligase [Patescibacteria group bacterium]|nr:cysteine--tRNA ligase [Patescibacteria group bacterium]
MKVYLYNTLSRKVEEFIPLVKTKVSMYTCGMTVYDHTTVGHMRTYVNTDVLRRVLEYNGLEVVQVENITDVGHLTGDGDLGEDKLEKASSELGKSAWAIAKKYEKEFFDVMDKLNVLRPTIICRATEHIDEMINLVKLLEKKGFAYKTTNGIYFDTSKINDYNVLSGMPLKELSEGARVEKNPEKKNPTDFALWKFSPSGKKRQMEWDSPWGKSFPGWHIECSAMSMKYLGERFDIHTGGEDHISVHHTNERAQNIAAVGHSVVSLWFHNTFLMINGEKMSKSKKNYFWGKDIKERGFDYLAIRYLFLTGHYRSRINFTWESLEFAQASLYSLYFKLAKISKKSKIKPLDKDQDYYKNFLKFVNRDLSIPQALALAWETLKSDIDDGQKLALLFDWDRVFSLNLRLGVEKALEIPDKVLKLIEKRDVLRKEKKWEEADGIRDEISSLGYRLMDMEETVVFKVN